MPKLGQGVGWGGTNLHPVLLCVDSPLLCFVNSGSFYPFVVLFVFIKFIKNKFLGLIESQNHVFACFSGTGCLQITSNTREILKVV